MIFVMAEREKSTPESRAKDSKEISEYVSKKHAQQKAKREDVNQVAFKVVRESTGSE